jgi:hypothetical protein
LGPDLTINAADGAIESGTAAGDGIVNQGTINLTGSLSIGGYAVTNAGAIGGSGDLTVSYISAFTNDNGETISGDSLDFFNSGGVDYSNGFTNNATISGNALSISGDNALVTNTGTLSAANLNIGVNYDYLFDGGSGFTNTGAISGNILSISAYENPFTNEGTIAADGSGNSDIYFYAPSSGYGSFDNEDSIAAANGATLSLTFGGVGGVNNGTISVGSGSRLIFSGSLAGTGSMVIQDGGTLELKSGTLADTVDFAGVGTMQLDGPNLLTGALSGLNTGDLRGRINRKLYPRNRTPGGGLFLSPARWRWRHRTLGQPHGNIRDGAVVADRQREHGYLA